MLRAVDEVVERVGSLVKLAVFIPLISEIVAASDMGNCISETTVQQR